MTSPASSISTSVRSSIVLFLAVALFAVGCGSSADTASDTVVDVATDAAETVVEADDSLVDATSASTETPIVEDTEGGAVQVVDSGTPVDLFEWGLAAPAEIASGDVLFSISNTGSFNHELAIARGASYESLPLLASGAVDEAALGEDFLGRTETFGSGVTIEAIFGLEPGDYVLFCNIAVGPNSHAANGQVKSITVS